ncbi:hypothetical protein OIU76_017184 [Salix suchowensis]|nr:hypothetical protein OIU76_017184 [Salix suchowensis]
MTNAAFLWHKVEPNQEFYGLVCEGASVLPTKFKQDGFRGGWIGFQMLRFSLGSYKVTICRGRACNQKGTDTGKVDLIRTSLNVRMEVSPLAVGYQVGEWITSGPLSGLIGSFAFSS